MKFVLVDRIQELDPGKRIVTTKALTLAEEYLADHFPTFPVMPGVLMLEAMIQSAAWLVRASEDFAHSMILLKEAKNVTYKSFVAPGGLLELEVHATRIEGEVSEFNGVGRCDGQEAVKARLTLRHFNLADEEPSLAAMDEKLIAQARSKLAMLSSSSVTQPTAAL